MRHAMFLVPVALAVCVSVASAETVCGLGVFAGAGIPSGDQGQGSTKDTKTGILWGFRLPIAMGKISLEPFMERTEGAEDQAYNGTLDGYDKTSFGANLGLGDLVRNTKGMHFTPYVGGALEKMRREGGPSDDVFGWRAGLSLGLGTGETTHWDLRGDYNSVGKIDPEADPRKYINVSLGLTCVISPR